MASSTDEGGAEILSPDAAFSALGNETRIEILQTLGEADSPLSFTELRNRVGIRHGGQFNYHLDKLVGHFVEKTDEEYELRQAGRRVVEAVLSGAVTEAPRVEPTRIDQSCPSCGAPIEVSYREEHLGFYCIGCAGLFGKSDSGAPSDEVEGYLGALRLPPAGVQGRTAEEMVEAAWVWGGLDTLARACGVCPRCSATLDRSVIVCESHDAMDDVCDQCDRRNAALYHVCCTNCIYESRAGFTARLIANTELMAFLTTHGVNYLTTQEWVTPDYDEEILSTKPFKARFTYTIDDDTLSLTVDNDLNVVNVSKSKMPESSR